MSALERRTIKVGDHITIPADTNLNSGPIGDGFPSSQTLTKAKVELTARVDSIMPPIQKGDPRSFNIFVYHPPEYKGQYWVSIPHNGNGFMR